MVLQAWRRNDRDLMQGHLVIRIGFTTSRKVGNAVARNRARRRLREAARLVLPAAAAAGWDYVLIGRRSTLSRPFADLLGDLRSSLGRLGAERTDCTSPPPAPIPPADRAARGAATGREHSR